MGASFPCTASSLNVFVNNFLFFFGGGGGYYLSKYPKCATLLNNVLATVTILTQTFTYSQYGTSYFKNLKHEMANGNNIYHPP